LTEQLLSLNDVHGKSVVSLLHDI